MRLKASDLTLGDTFDLFGEHWTIVRFEKRKTQIQMFRCDKDVFGKEILEYKTFHIDDLSIMRRLVK